MNCDKNYFGFFNGNKWILKQNLDNKESIKLPLKTWICKNNNISLYKIEISNNEMIKIIGGKLNEMFIPLYMILNEKGKQICKIESFMMDQIAIINGNINNNNMICIIDATSSFKELLKNIEWVLEI